MGLICSFRHGVIASDGGQHYLGPVIWFALLDDLGELRRPLATQSEF